MSDLHDRICQDTARKQAPSASLYPYALVGSDGVVLAPKRFDGVYRAAVFLDLKRARLGQLKWGGTVVDRYSGERF